LVVSPISRLAIDICCPAHPRHGLCLISHNCVARLPYEQTSQSFPHRCVYPNSFVPRSVVSALQHVLSFTNSVFCRKREVGAPPLLGAFPFLIWRPFQESLKMCESPDSPRKVPHFYNWGPHPSQICPSPGTS